MRANLILAIITIIFSIFFLIVALQLPETSSTTTVGPAGWPIIILVFMLSMGILLLINTILKLKKNNGTDEDEQRNEYTVEGAQDAVESPVQLSTDNPHIKYRHFYILISIAVYILLLPVIGFIIMTPILFFFLGWLLGIGSIIKVAVITIASNLLIFTVFIYLLNIPFPRGVGIFRSLSFFIY
ncbi:tripartite tricarboxylate transporter TctB family protein [Evansella halocellulosilytica]|uniref:tripartite tricarboxylate transporter TctB family protein n=1 Tax=Evansella halocellulosilytica TaxID=2011013 RepID=UPI000BB8BCB9|nr:tripartite tricarboxylate transporter TctB family protein [Evansella halocellulosilytica]